MSTKATIHIPIVHITETLAVADALGGGVEMDSAESLASCDLSHFHDRGTNPVYNTGYKPGMITDDTWMTLGLMDAVVKSNGGDLSDNLLLASYQEMYDKETKLITWSTKGKWWGGLEPVLQRNISYDSWLQSKPQNSNKDPSNGSVMRAHILGYLKEEALIMKYTDQDTYFSHPHPLAADCSRILALLVHYIAYKDLKLKQVVSKGFEFAKIDRVKAYLTRLESLPFESSPVEATKLVCTELNHNTDTNAYTIKNGGTGVPCNALYTLGAGLYVAKHVHGVLEAIQYAIRMGGDTDSVAIVTASLVGALAGKDQIEDSESLSLLKSKLLFRAEIATIAQQYETYVNK